MQISFDEELAGLKAKLLEMGAKVEQAVKLAVHSITARDSKLARRVLQSDAEINDLETQLDETCHKLLALHQPMAGDLRFITSCMKINSTLERQGDLAVDIAERALTLNEDPPVMPLTDIAHLAQTVQEMVKSSLDSLVNRDAVLAQRVCVRDDEVDALNGQLIRVLVSYMLQDRSNVKRALDLILVSRYLERIADHAVSVGADVIYLVTGKDIRHHLKEPAEAPPKP
jgi:phosphate transport system protein